MTTMRELLLCAARCGALAQECRNSHIRAKLEGLAKDYFELAQKWSDDVEGSDNKEAQPQRFRNGPASRATTPSPPGSSSVAR
jgi:hypothetical protein